ncbi:MAG TPA: aspartyl protease family protein [Verrucomicrobiae bacterium]|nr:aspartyl protease family protein [Verrucomicrobiae bacterium]
MPLPVVLFFSAAMLAVKPSPVYADVFIGTNGPYRFLVDTGAQTSRIDPKLAEKLNLAPEYRVEVVTQNSSRLLPAAVLKTLHIGKTARMPLEVVFDDPVEAKRLDGGVRGVLGINALAGADFTLSPGLHRLDLDGARPDGESLPLRRIEDLITIPARMGRETLTLILDSGANHVILFHTPEAMAKSPAVKTTLSTIDGARNVVPTCWTADMFFTNSLRVGTLPAAIVTSRGARADGLLPASVFKTIYVDQTRGEVVLVR